MVRTVVIGDDGQPKRAWQINGRDLGALLVEHQIWYDDCLSTRVKYNYSILAGLSSFGTLLGLKTHELIQKVINTWMIGVVNQTNSQINVAPFQFADKDFIQDKFVALNDTDVAYPVTIVDTDDNGNSINKLLTVLSGQGAISSKSYTDNISMQFTMMSNKCDLFNYVKSISNAPYHEVYIDTGGTTQVLRSDMTVALQPGKAYLIFRPTPYDDMYLNLNNGIAGNLLPSLLDMKDLTHWQITDEDITDRDLEQGRNNIPSSYFVIPSGGVVTDRQGKNLNFPYYDEVTLRRYGYNPLEINLNCLYFDKQNGNDVGSVADSLQAFQNKAFSWYRYSDRFLTGSFKIKGNELIRVGHALSYSKMDNGYIEDDYEEGYYYITDVAHDWNFGQRFTTSLMVDRGVSKKEFNLGFDPWSI